MKISGKEAIERLEKQYKRQNEFVKNNYDRISVNTKKGIKDQLKTAATARGLSVNELINELIIDYLEKQ